MSSDECNWDDIAPPSIRASSLPFLGHRGVIREGSMHLLAAHPKTGKTTLLLHIVREWHQAHDIACPPVLWLSEESQETWADRKANRDWKGLPLTVNFAWGKTPESLLAAAYWDYHPIVIVDTITSLMRIPNLNDNAVVSTHMSKWINPLRAKQKTVIFVHHLRKYEDGGFGVSVAGGYAFTGSVDAILEVREDTTIPNRRIVTTKSRWECPPKLIYEYSRGQLVPVGTETDVDIQTYKNGNDPSWRATHGNGYGEVQVLRAPPSVDVEAQQQET